MQIPDGYCNRGGSVPLSAASVVDFLFCFCFAARRHAGEMKHFSFFSPPPPSARGPKWIRTQAQCSYCEKTAGVAFFFLLFLLAVGSRINLRYRGVALDPRVRQFPLLFTLDRLISVETTKGLRAGRKKSHTEHYDSLLTYVRENLWEPSRPSTNFLGLTSSSLQNHVFRMNVIELAALKVDARFLSRRR